MLTIEALEEVALTQDKMFEKCILKDISKHKHNRTLYGCLVLKLDAPTLSLLEKKDNEELHHDLLYEIYNLYFNCTEAGEKKSISGDYFKVENYMSMDNMSTYLTSHIYAFETVDTISKAIRSLQNYTIAEATEKGRYKYTYFFRIDYDVESPLVVELQITETLSIIENILVTGEGVEPYIFD